MKTKSDDNITILICADDTDELGGPGTGKLLQALLENITEKGWGTCSAISRHQLYVHDDIPYTSHNSALCFEAAIHREHLSQIIEFSGIFIEKNSAQGSDPGLCVSDLSALSEKEKLISFGYHAKKTVLTKKDAYDLASYLNIHLSEHGGTGQGVVGAVAGTGLRLSGNDGRFRGWYHLARAGEKIYVNALTAYDFIDAVKSEDGTLLSGETLIRFGGDTIKPVLQDGMQVILVKEKEDENGNRGWETLTRREVKKY